MSHFTVLVATKTRSEDDLRAALQPYHEFECTGTEDEYVVDVDETEELLETWREMKTNEVPNFEVESFREWVKSYTGREEVLPGGRAKYGWTEVTSLNPDGEVIRCIDRTNPNDKWDWWEVGGRWSGFLTLKASAVAQNSATKADAARKGDVDMASKIEAETRAAATRWDDAHAIIAGRTWVTWEEAGKRYEGKWDEARKFYHDQDAVKALGESEKFRWINDCDDFLLDRDTYARRKGMRSAMTFAILHNGEWHEKGKMGWWALVTNEKDREAWEDEWFRVYNSIPDDYTVTVVDCHI